jgi:hypothetical protein
MRSNSVSSISSIASLASTTEPESTMQIFIKNVSGDSKPYPHPHPDLNTH